MSLQLLLIPALGGYWILSQAHITKYRILRESGYHLFLSVALVGTVVLCMARICVVIFDGFFPIHLVRLWQSYAPFDYSGTVALSGVFAFAIPYLLNFFTNEKKEAMQAARVSGDFLECILQEAIEKNAGW